MTLFQDSMLLGECQASKASNPQSCEDNPIFSILFIKMQTILRSSKQAGSRTFATTVFPVTDAFKKRHIGPQTGERDEMLEALGFSTLEGGFYFFYLLFFSLHSLSYYLPSTTLPSFLTKSNSLFFFSLGHYLTTNQTGKKKTLSLLFSH